MAKLSDLRLPGNLANSVRLQPVAFKEQSYEVEPNVSFKDEKGIVNTKMCAVTNFIRWRHASSKPDKKEEAEEKSDERLKMER